MNTEIWKWVPEFEGYYEVSNLGRIKSYKQHSGGKIMSMTNRKGGYFSIVLSAGGKTRSARIHRLVAELYIPNPDGLNYVNHKDLNKQNNHHTNLEWVTQRENNFHAQQLKPSIVKALNDYNKFERPIPVLQVDMNGNVIAEYPNCAEAARKTKVCRRNIQQVAYNVEYKPGKTRKQAGGYQWRLKEKK